MNLKQAKQILTGMELEQDYGCSPILYKARPYHLYVRTLIDGPIATLNGDFTADKLEAIATWMRDPSGVVGAE